MTDSSALCRICNAGRKVGLLLAAVIFYSVPCRADPWQTIAKDLQIARIQLSPRDYFTPELLFLRFPLKSYRLAVIRARQFEKPRITARAAARLSNALIAINANFFDEAGRPLGLVVSQGVKYQNIHRGGKTLTGIMSISRNSTEIVHRDNFDPTGTIEAIQAGPRLLTAGKKVPGIKASNTYSRRAGICLGQNQTVVLFISSGIIGLTINQLQELLLSPVIGCQEALNLDGGGSAQLYIMADLPEAQQGLQEIFIHGRDPAPVYLGVFQNIEID